MDDEEFEQFQRSLIDPMIRRHDEMFPLMHHRGFTDRSENVLSVQPHPRTPAPAAKYPATDRYAPCSCNSGEKFRFCCGAKRR